MERHFLFLLAHLSIIKMSVLPNLIYKYNLSPIKMPTLFIKLDPFVLNFLCKINTVESERCRGEERWEERAESQSATLAELSLLSWGWIKGGAGEGVETILAAENSHQPTANKEVRCTVLRPPATQFYKQDEWSWKAVHPRNPNKDAHLMTSSSQPWETRVENKPSQTDTWPTKPYKYCTDQHEGNDWVCWGSWNAMSKCG